jgi:Fe-S cluster biogenesis protein NfuA
MKTQTIFSLASLLSASAFHVTPITSRSRSVSTYSSSSSVMRMSDTIVSPFDNTNTDSDEDDGEDTETVALKEDVKLVGPLDLTWENVEAVLDEMRHYLIQDGGNVIIAEIDGPVVRLELQGNCGSCPSSTQTMKMGLEKGLREKIPEIQEVVQSLPSGPPLEVEQINVVLDGVRPFLQVAGGSIEIDKLENVGGLQPVIWLDMQGSAASLVSVKLEIAQRLQRHFMMSGLQVQWKGEEEEKW